MNAFHTQVPAVMNDGDIIRPVLNGTYYIYVTDAIKVIGDRVSFTVSGVQIEANLSFDQGYVGEELEITGEGFWPGENVQILFDTFDITADYVDGSRVVGSSGANEGKFAITIPIPTSSNGEKEVKVKGLTSGIEVDLAFTVLPKLIATPVDGEPGIQVIVTGTGFARSNYVDIYFDNTLLLRTTQRTSNGTFMQAITVPAGKAPGAYQIKAVDGSSTSINASATFTVTAPPLNPAITLTSHGETVGSIIAISGVQFGNNKPITLKINDQAVTPDSPITSTSTGTFSGSFTIPEMPAGTYTLEAGDGTWEATDTFTVSHEATISKASGKTGDVVIVTGTGFRANTAVTVTFAGNPVVLNVASPKTDANGSFEYTFTVPAVAEGTHNVEISVSPTSITKTFATALSLTLNPTSGKAGDQVSLSAEGFAPNANAVVSFGNTPLATGTTDGTGRLSVVFTVPASAEGTHAVKLEVAGISKSVNFTIAANMIISPANGIVGTQVTVSGNGFGINLPVTITFG
jgi:hypothetical protein